MREQASDPAALTAVRAPLEHIERKDLAQATLDYAEDGVLEARRRGGVSLKGTFLGRAAITDWLENWFSSFQPGSYRFEIADSIENGDRLYLRRAAGIAV